MLLSLLLLFFSCFSAPSLVTSSPSEGGGSISAAMSAYEVLRSQGLPMGLFPKGVKDFRVDADGQFEARLEVACTATFESEVLYNASVTGRLSYGQIAGLSGVAAQDLFLWFPVRRIRVDIPSSGLIYFDVGVVYKRFSLSLFETPPDCVPVSDPAATPSRLAAAATESQSGKLRHRLDHEGEDALQQQAAAS